MLHTIAQQILDLVTPIIEKYPLTDGDYTVMIGTPDKIEEISFLGALGLATGMIPAELFDLDDYGQTKIDECGQMFPIAAHVDTFFKTLLLCRVVTRKSDDDSTYDLYAFNHVVSLSQAGATADVIVAYLDSLLSGDWTIEAA